MATNTDNHRISMLRSVLDRFATGPIPDAAKVERAVADCWHDFDGHAENGMAGYKLIGRMENVKWHPPILSFSLERHGGTVLGSTRAEVHRWQVDLDQMTAECNVVGQRRVRTVATAVRQDELQQTAEEVATLIQNGAADFRLVWKDANNVHVVLGQIIPSKSGVKRTVQGRRKRLRQALETALTRFGWKHVARNIFRRAESTQAGPSMISDRDDDK